MFLFFLFYCSSSSWWFVFETILLFLLVLFLVFFSLLLFHMRFWPFPTSSEILFSITSPLPLTDLSPQFRPFSASAPTSFVACEPQSHPLCRLGCGSRRDLYFTFYVCDFVHVKKKNHQVRMGYCLQERKKKAERWTKSKIACFSF